MWALPTVAVVLALIAGSALALVDIGPDSPLEPLVFQGTADDARSLLIGIASTMVTVIALVLGLTVVALQLASTQYSPRLLRNFLRDRVNQIVLSVFVATFTYSTAGLYTVGVSAGQRTSSFPRLAVTGALVLLFASLVMLVFFVHHLVHSIQIDEIMTMVEKNTLHVIERDLPTLGITADPLPDPPVWAVPLPAHRSGYVQALHPDALLATAVSRDVIVSVTAMVGDHLVAGSPLVWLWRPSPEQPPPHPTEFEHVVREAVRIGFERTMEQDAAFGVRQLADIASKALSPAINDPYTAVQALQHIAVVLAELSHRPLGNQLLRDPAGAPPRRPRAGPPPTPPPGLAPDSTLRRARPPKPPPPPAEPPEPGRAGGGGGNPGGPPRPGGGAAPADAEAAIVQPADLAPVQQDAERVLREVSG